jgi:hypothetical protein
MGDLAKIAHIIPLIWYFAAAKGQNIKWRNIMEQQSEEKKFLLLLNENNGSVRIAAYPDEQNPEKAKTVDPKRAPAESFMTFNGKDAIDEFIENYRRQNSYPQGLRWMYAPFKVLENIGNALFKFKNGDQQALSPYREYETKPYFKNVIPERDLPLKDLGKMGYSEEYLTNPNTIEKLKRREPLQPVRMTRKVDGVAIDGMFSPRVVTNPKTGKPMVRAEQCHGKEILQKPYMGYSFSKKQQEKLLKERHLGEVIRLTDPKTKEQFDALISLHPYTNKPYHADTRYLNIPDNIKGQGIDNEMLAKGGRLKLENYKAQSGKSYSPVVQYDAFMKRLDFDFKAFRIPNKIGGIELTEQQKADYAAGKRVDLGEPKNKDGSAQKPVIYQGENGRTRRDKRNEQEQAAYQGARQETKQDDTTKKKGRKI